MHKEQYEKFELKILELKDRLWKLYSTRHFFSSVTT
jgi:hypothetical protein